MSERPKSLDWQDVSSRIMYVLHLNPRILDSGRIEDCPPSCFNVVADIDSG